MTDYAQIESRVAELEIRTSFQDQTLQQLNEVIVRQQRELESLLREFGRLKGHLSGATPHTTAAQQEEPPPHY